jgi:hypothetical protein
MHYNAMLPNKAANAWVFWNCFISAVWIFVTCFNGFHRDIIHEGKHEARDLMLKDKCNIAVKYLAHIGVSLR